MGKSYICTTDGRVRYLLVLGIVMGVMLEFLMMTVIMSAFAAVIGLYGAGYIYLLRKNIEKNFIKTFFQDLIDI